MASFASHPPAVRAFRHLPLSPRDADHDMSRIPPVSPGVDVDMTSANGLFQGIAPGRTTARYQPRRPSTLSYQNSDARDPRDRTYARSPRNLVVVLPPPDLPLDQGHLGNVLSMGPRYRLPQGILMPLFPSMFGQLNAIAREYNFPSTAGLCLYLHVNESGATRTPRISEDSWQYLFGHLFEGPASSTQQLPIGGSIEFDIDLNKARWFDAWVAGTLRESDPAFPSVITSHAPFGAHWRGESQTTTSGDEPQAEDRWDVSGSQTLVANSRPGTLRHPPRKLSLVDRLDSHILHIPPKSQNPPDSPTHALSPVPQSAVPQPATKDLERRVNSWRASTELCPVSMTETYQPAPDIEVSLHVTAMDEYALESGSQKGIDHDDYLWSLTTAGLGTPAMESPLASSRPISVHLDRRANGFVPLTPTTVTSWGPADDELSSVISNETRLPSPSIGERVAEDTMDPRQCAVWGNSFGWSSTVTWKEVYPYSAAQVNATVQVMLQDSNGLVRQYPNLVIYPAVDDMHSTSNVSRAIQSSPQSVWGTSFGWQNAVTWRKVYPYSTLTTQSVDPIQLCGAGGLESKYPDLCIYPAAYPNIDIYPACIIQDFSQPISVMLKEPSNATMSKGWSRADANIYSLNVALPYPTLVIYPAVYPHFDLYPRTLQITRPPEQEEVDVRLKNAGCLAAEYPNMTIYPSAYPHLEIYPRRETRRPASTVTWGVSFGWLTAKTWLQVYPLHSANPLTGHGVDDQSKFISGPQVQGPATADVRNIQAIWGSSFGWEYAATWRSVWPTSRAPSASPVSVHLGQQNDSTSEYPDLVIYPAVYPHFDLYPPRAAIAEVAESKMTEKDQCTVNLIPLYPSLVIYPAVYPHLDVYQPFARDLVAIEQGKGHSNLRRRRIEMWRARTAAQVGLTELLANNHTWEAEEPLQLDLADYAWSQSSAGPRTPPLELPRSPSGPGSIHIDRRIQGSVLLTPSTATTWGPQDDDWYSDISSIERPPSPDLGQRAFDDEVESLPSVLEILEFVPEYPDLVIYPPAYPHFDLYPTWAGATMSKGEVAETLVNSNNHPVLDSYPTIYPYLNIYPAILQVEVSRKVVSSAWHERVEVKLPALYPNIDIYHACYPYSLDSIYPSISAIESTEMSTEASHVYPWFVVYSPVYPFVIPYLECSPEINPPLKPEQPPSVFALTELQSVGVKLPTWYPTLDLYPAGYPRSLESIYPAVSVDGYSVVKLQHVRICINPSVYPFVEPYPGASDSVHMPGTLDGDEYASAKAFLALSGVIRPNHGSNSAAADKPQLELNNPGHAVYPYFDLYPTPQALAPQERTVRRAYVDQLATPVPQILIMTRRNQKSHTELHASVSQSSGKWPARNLKTHVQLHDEVFQDGVVWTPSGCIRGTAVQDTGVDATQTRKTHMELHVSVLRALGKQPAGKSKTHARLHSEVFHDGIVWTPSGYVQDITPQTKRQQTGVPVQESRRRPPQVVYIPRPLTTRSGTNITQAQSPEKVAFPISQPPALPPLSPLRVRSPPIPSQPPPAVSEIPIPRVSSPTMSPYMHRRTTSSRLTQAVKSILPGLQRRSASTSVGPESPPPEENKEQGQGQQPPTRFLSLIDRRSSAAPPLPHANASTSELLTRAPASSQRKDSLALQRARAYDRATATAVNRSRSPVGANGTHVPFILPPLPQIPPMTDVAETIEISKFTLS